MEYRITELQGMAFQNMLGVSAEISAAWKYNDNLDTEATLKVMGVNLSGETEIDTFFLKRVIGSNGASANVFTGAIFKTITAGLYTHVFVKIDTNNTNVDIKDVTFHNRMFPNPEEGSEIIQSPDVSGTTK